MPVVSLGEPRLGPPVASPLRASPCRQATTTVSKYPRQLSAYLKAFQAARQVPIAGRRISASRHSAPRPGPPLASAARSRTMQPPPGCDYQGAARGECAPRVLQRRKDEKTGLRRLSLRARQRAPLQATGVCSPLRRTTVPLIRKVLCVGEGHATRQEAEVGDLTTASPWLQPVG